MHKANDIHVSNVTHAGRRFNPTNLGNHGLGKHDVGAIGRWTSGQGSMPIYDGSLPREAMLAAASHNPRKPEHYSLPREKLGRFAIDQYDAIS